MVVPGAFNKKLNRFSFGGFHFLHYKMTVNKDPMLLTEQLQKLNEMVYVNLL